MLKTKTRTIQIKKNNNISFPIGTAVTVKKYAKKLNFEHIFSKLKKRGILLKNLVEALISYRLTENMSLSRASKWINREEVLDEFNLKFFEQKTLYRTVDVIGKNYHEIILNLQDVLFELYDFDCTDVNMDWSSIILWGLKSNLGKYGYSRDKRPDKKQITFGITELRKPINIPIGFTVAKGNLNDQNHFKQTFNQVNHKLKKDSLIIFDKGANSEDNLNSVIASKMKYLTAKKLNVSDDKLFNSFFQREDLILINKNTWIVGLKKVYDSRVNYFFFSSKLESEQIESKLRKAKKQFDEAEQFQLLIDSKKKLPKKYQITNPLIDMKYSYQTKLPLLTKEEAFEKVKKTAITGREGFFCLTSKDNLTLNEALNLYREKDSVEKIMHSLKNEINIKPVRVWSDNGIIGVLLIGYLANLIISLIRYDEPELKKLSTKFIKISLSNLTVTIEMLNHHKKRRVYSNFDPINELICMENTGIT